MALYVCPRHYMLKPYSSLGTCPIPVAPAVCPTCESKYVLTMNGGAACASCLTYCKTIPCGKTLVVQEKKEAFRTRTSST